MSPSWRPLPPEGTNDPRPVADSLAGLARRLGAPAPAVLGVVFARWEEAVGPALAARTRPVSLVDGVLVVAVTEPAWATHVRYLAPSLTARLAELAGTDAVTRVEVRVSR